MADKTTIEGELRVKDILKERGIKMKDLAEQIHIAPETLTRALKGNPQYSTLKSIADILGISVRELFNDNSVSTENKYMCGCIFYGGKMFTFNNYAEMEKFLIEHK